MKKNHTYSGILKGFIFIVFTVFLSLGSFAQTYNYIVGHPRDVTVVEKYDRPVIFSVEAVGEKLSYQWLMKIPGEDFRVMKDEISPILELPFSPEKPVTAKVWDGVAFKCAVEGGLGVEESLPAFLWVIPERSVITASPKDAIREEGFVGTVDYSVEVIPKLEGRFYWFIRLPGASTWKEAGEGQRFGFNIEKPLTMELNGTAFRCLVRYDGGEEFSDVAYLWVEQPKKYIVIEPMDVTEPEGYRGEVYFNIKTEGDYLEYQWQIQIDGVSWKNLADEIKRELYYPFKEPLTMEQDGWAFRCVVTDKVGYMEYSEPAFLHVEQQRRYITQDPLDITKKQGFVGELYFYIKYEGSGLAFQWQVKEPGGVWKDYPDHASEPDFYFPVKEPLTPEWNGYAFRCVVVDEKGYVEYSNAAYLYVSLYETFILAHPRNVTACEKYVGDIGFRIKVIDGPVFTFQWQMKPPKESNFIDIKGAVEPEYTQYFDGLSLSFNEYAYRCRVMDEKGVTEFSNVAFLYVNALPRIVTHPISQTKKLGEGVTFNVSASGAKPLSYQWLKDGVNIPGANATSYTIKAVAENDAGGYRVRVSNSCLPSGVLSKIATLTVEVPEWKDGWISQSAGTTKNITDVSFSSKNHGWISVVNSALIYNTSNGGKSWRSHSPGVSADWQAVFTTDPTHVWAAGGAYIKYTTDTTIWNSATLPPAILTAPVFYDLYFVDNSKGWAVGDNGLILSTINGGANWAVQNSGDIGGYVTDALLEAVHFTVADTGWIVGNQGKILVTKNGGSTWALQTSDITDNLKDVFFINSKNGWAAGENDVLLHTTNGGTTWTPVDIGDNSGLEASRDLNGVYFADLLNGWVITSTGKIFRTNDGGNTWYSQATGTTHSLNSIDFVDYDNGWVVGDAGTILRTAYSGCLLPTVNLFDDKSFCASVNYELKADTFAKNVDCSYQWSTGEVTGSITVNSSGSYYVNVTSVCGEQVSDTVHIELYPLPVVNAGSDQEICEGDSVQLMATGGVLYSWNNEMYLNDHDIQNPKAGPPAGNTDFIVTVTDDNLCENADTVTITVYEIPTSTFTAPLFVCGKKAVNINYTGSASASANYYWAFDEGSTIHSGDSVGPYQVSWDTAGIKTMHLIVEENGCSSDTTYLTISVNVIPESDFDVQARVCGNDATPVTYTGNASGGATYNWYFGGGTTVSGSGQGPYEISWGAEGTKSVSLYVTENFCSSDTTEKNVVVAYPYEGAEICLVTIDLETGKNMVVWERTKNLGIASFNIYRESSTGNVYELIGNVPFGDLSEFVDKGSVPETKSNKYKISVIDTCSNESERSPYHKTMLLTSNLGPNSINLSWTEYVVEDGGFGFIKYLIYRGTSPKDLKVYDSIANDNTLYPDYYPESDTMYYRIAGVKATLCDPNTVGKKAGTGPYSHSLSNLEENRLQVGGVNNILTSKYNFRIYPNPFNQVATVTYDLAVLTDVRIEVYNLLGARILDMVNERQNPGNYSYELRSDELGSAEGIYYLRFTVNGQTLVKKVIQAR